MNLKPHNLILNDECVLKIANFNYSQSKTEGPILKKGTKNFRPPEVKKGKWKNPL